MKLFFGKPDSLAAQRAAQGHADQYRYFLPTWPALWQSFQRDADRIAAALKEKQQ